MIKNEKPATFSGLLLLKNSVEYVTYVCKIVSTRIILFIIIQSAHIMGKVTKVLQMYLSTFLRLPWSPGIEITSAPAKSNPSKHEQSPYLSTTHFCSDLVVLCVLIYRTRWYTWKKVEIKPEGGKGSLAWPVWMEQGGWTVFNFPWLSRHES